MLNYTVSRVTGQPDWETIPALTMENRYLETTNAVQAWAQIAYNQEAFLVHLSIRTPEIRSVEFGPMGMPCEDSCLEFFFQPVDGDARYINLEFNFNGCYYLGVATGIPDLVRLVPEGGGNTVFAPDIRKTEDGWEIFYQIPFSFIRRLFPSFEAIPGKAMRANCYACSDLTTPHYYLSWSPVSTDPFTFHRSACFGTMILEK